MVKPCKPPTLLHSPPGLARVGNVNATRGWAGLGIHQCTPGLKHPQRTRLNNRPRHTSCATTTLLDHRVCRDARFGTDPKPPRCTHAPANPACGELLSHPQRLPSSLSWVRVPGPTASSLADLANLISEAPATLIAKTPPLPKL